tara:strand:+ start:498 stop:686 length:189 start_codon:yes stop_codon:yes gene_type:complete
LEKKLVDKKKENLQKGEFIDLDDSDFKKKNWVPQNIVKICGNFYNFFFPGFPCLYAFKRKLI